MQTIITFSLYLMAILVPIVFTTFNFELFEFPKFIILLSGTLIISAAWLLHIIKTKDIKIKMTHLHYGVLAVLFTQTLSTIFSIHPYTSFWGYYSRFHQGLLTTICYTIIYFAAVKWLDKRSTQKLIKISVTTAFLIGIYGILEHFGIDKSLWIQDVQNRVFSTLGQPNWLAAYLIPNIFLAMYLSSISKSKKPIIYFIVLTTLFLTLIFTKSRSGFIAFIISYAIYWLLRIRQSSFAKIKNNFFIYSTLIILPLVLFGSPYTPSINSWFTAKPVEVVAQPQGTVLEFGGTESGDIRKIVWSGALKLIADHPILGTGAETFAYTYYWARPQSHNMTSEWDFLYNKAHNEYLNIAATTGLLGLLAYLAWHFSIFYTGLTIIPKTKKVTQEKEDSMRMYYPVVAASVVAFTVTNFFGFSVIPVYLMMIIISAIPASQNEKQTEPIAYSPVAILATFIPLFYTLQLFLADMNYARGKQYLDAGQIGNAIPYLQKAVRTRPSLDLYHSTLGEAYASAGQKDQALQELSINRKLNPYHLNFYKSRAKIYLTLASVDPSYNIQAAEELSKARTLAPTDPKLAYNLGLIYTRLSAADKAEEQLKDAISLKPNYAEPYYALTLLYEQTKQVTKIKPVLEDAKTKLATYSSQLKEKIEKYTTK